MAKPHSHTTSRAFMRSPFIIGVMLVAALGAALGAVRLHTKERAFAQQMQEREMIHERLKDEYQKLNEEVMFLESDRGQEEIIRRQFDVTREGESLVIIPVQPIATEKTEPLDMEELPEKSLWQSLFFWR